MRKMNVNEAKKIRIALTGSRTYENKQKIKDMLFQLKHKFGSDLEVVSRGDKVGADKYVRKYAIDFGIAYKEFNPAHTVKTLYSAMSESYYGKPYHVSQFHHRNKLMVKYCDYLIMFREEHSDDSNGMLLEATKLKKQCIIINDL
jgi:hypothetical protein